MMFTRIIVVFGGLLALIAALPIYLRATPAPLHPDPQRAPSVQRSHPSPVWTDAVERARESVRAALAEQNLPGLSVAVGAGGTIVWAEGFGWSDIRTGAPVTPDTQFRIGTASPVLTSAAIGVLLDQGALTLDDDIRTHVPGFPAKSSPVTLRQVMGHVAGLTSDSPDDRPLFGPRCERPADALPHFADRELLFQPGTQYRHSNYDWILVSAAVEAASGRPFRTFMREQIFAPLQMDRTGAESAAEENPDAIGEPAEDAPFLRLFHDLVLEPLGVGGTNTRSATPGLATFYRPGFGPDPDFRHGLHVVLPRNLSCYAGAMAFFSTPSDLVRFGLAMHGGSLVQPSTVQLLQTAQRLTSGEQTGYGLGWELETVALGGEPAQTVGHDGELWGAKVSLLTLPERGIVVAVMANISHAETSAIARSVAEAFAK